MEEDFIERKKEYYQLIDPLLKIALKKLTFLDSV